jgi:hypothetical protein
MGVGICILITDGDKRLSRLCRIMEQGVHVYSRQNPSEKGTRNINGQFSCGNPIRSGAVQNSINPALYSSFLIIQWSDIGLVSNMDECLNDDDDEEHHRVFFTFSGAQHDRFSVHAGNDFLKTENAFHPDPAGGTAWLQPCRNKTIPVPAGTDGRSTNR